MYDKFWYLPCIFYVLQQATTSNPRTAVILQPSPGFLVRPIHPVNKLPLPKLKPRVATTTRAIPPARAQSARKTQDHSKVKKSSKKTEAKEKDPPPPSVAENVEEEVKNKGARYVKHARVSWGWQWHFLRKELHSFLVELFGDVFATSSISGLIPSPSTTWPRWTAPSQRPS